MLYKKAAELAVYTGKQLQPFCEVVNIAGSLRRISGMQGRDRMEVNDIDLVCIPRYTEVVALELFGETKVAQKKTSISFVETIKSIGAITKGSPDGRYMSLIIRGHKVDVFMPDPADYYRQYCIRTGSANYVHWNISKKWNEKGWCGTDQGLRRMEDCRRIISASEKTKWEVVRDDGEKPPAWESEQHFFDWLGVKWIQPHVRSI
jgi:DNA polymerase/3'-5' exonuclease PolX